MTISFLGSWVLGLGFGFGSGLGPGPGLGSKAPKEEQYSILIFNVGVRTSYPGGELKERGTAQTHSPANLPSNPEPRYSCMGHREYISWGRRIEKP
jgi:hypothetical protein